MQPRIIQIEVSTRCQLRCSFCPHTLLKDHWITKDISRDTFSDILSHVGKGQLVHLQGWGEPLLHPQIWDMAAAVKRKGGRVSMTTNGLLLDDDAVRNVCDIGFDFIAISVAGAVSAVHDSLRIGSSLAHICDNIISLSATKSHPHIHLVMQMMKPNISELPALVDLAAELKVDRVIAPNLDYIPDAGTEQLRAFSEISDPELERIIMEAQLRAKKLGIPLHVYPLQPGEDFPVCSDDPLHNIVISVNGEVSPCVYLCLPIEDRIPRWFQGETCFVDRFIYGKVGDGLHEVLGNRSAEQFMAAFEQRIQCSKFNAAESMAILTLPGIRSARKALQHANSQGRPQHPIKIPDAPSHCRACYKLLGI
ncbi:MAG: radical SAM/SPASM domain-containing protein [Dehalococcoidia bacterium]